MVTGGDRQETLGKLAQEIRLVLVGGLPQDQATLDTVLVALGETDIRAALARLAADPEDSEHAPLVALLLSPGPAAMRRLEFALTGADVGVGEALELAELVAQGFNGHGRGKDTGSGRVLVLLPDGSGAEVAAPADGLRAFVRRLRPEATAPAELRAILARRCGAGLAVELAVLLRHCRLAWTPERVFFVGALLERAPVPLEGAAVEVSGRDGLPDLLAWATGFLEDIGLQPEFRRALAARRQALLAQLRQAEFMEEAFARGNYETLLSQGLRFAHVHGPDVRAELVHLERAGHLVLGLPGEALDGVGVRDLGCAEDAQALLRLLPGLED